MEECTSLLAGADTSDRCLCPTARLAVTRLAGETDAVLGFVKPTAVSDASDADEYSDQSLARDVCCVDAGYLCAGDIDCELDDSDNIFKTLTFIGYMKQGKARIIDLPKIVDPRGNLTVAEQMKNVPFDIARVYWTYDVPSGERRGGHAHRTCEEIVIAVSGSFDVEVYDGKERQTFHLNHPYQGLYIGTGVWRTLEDFSSGAVCLVLASELFDEDEYIYDYEEFLRSTKDV